MNEPGRISDGRIPDSTCPDRRNKTAFVFRGEPYTYGWLDERVTRLEAGLRARFEPGDILALWMENSPDLVAVLLACFRSGVVPMPLHGSMRWPEAETLLELAAVQALVVSSAVGDYNRMTATHVTGDVYVSGGGERASGRRSFRELLSSTNGAIVSGAQPVRDGEPLLILLTSGSEGRPKCVMISRPGLEHILEYRLERTGLTSESVSVMASCLSQSVGLYQSLAMLAAGGTLILLDSYEVDPLAEAVNGFRPTHLIMVAHAYSRLLCHPTVSRDSFRNIAFAAAGADKVTDRVQRRFIELTGRPLAVSYGLTESSWALTNFEGRLDKRLALGKPCPGIEIRLLDEMRSDVPPPGVGELFIRSPRTMLGYLNDVEATQSVLRDGWLATGDLAWQDEEGYFWFAGRKKNLVVLSSGDNVSPIEVEQVALTHPLVASCLVVPGPDEQDAEHEVPWMYVVPVDAALGESTLREFLLDRISEFKVPRKIFFVPELPLGPTGKLTGHSSRPNAIEARVSHRSRS